MPEDSNPYRLQIPIEVQHQIGLDPETMTQARRNEIIAVQCAFMAGSLFWLLRNLGEYGDSSTRRINTGQMFLVLEFIGQLGEALTDAAAKHTELVSNTIKEGAQ